MHLLRRSKMAGRKEDDARVKRNDFPIHGVPSANERDEIPPPHPSHSDTRK